MKHRIPVLLSLVALLAPAAHAQSTREVTYDPHIVVRIEARLRMSTLIVLPEGEQILDFVCGDKDYWVVSGADNLAYVKPAKPKAVTNLNLVTATGHVYSFRLEEGAADPDVKVFVRPDPSVRPSTRAFVSQSNGVDAESLKRDVAAARADADRAKRDAEDALRTHQRKSQESLDAFKVNLPLQLRFPYTFKARTKPFNVTAIYHDDRFTYIRAEGHELPALYEVVDHVPNLVSYQVQQGVFIVPKILEHGYLAIGAKRLPFDTAVR